VRLQRSIDCYSILPLARYLYSLIFLVFTSLRARTSSLYIGGVLTLFFLLLPSSREIWLQELVSGTEKKIWRHLHFSCACFDTEFAPVHTERSAHRGFWRLRTIPWILIFFGFPSAFLRDSWWACTVGVTIVESRLVTLAWHSSNVGWSVCLFRRRQHASERRATRMTSCS